MSAAGILASPAPYRRRILILSMRLTPLIAIVLAAVASTGCGGPSEGDLLAQARGKLEAKDARGAVIVLKNLLEKAPDSAEGRFMLGKALLTTGDMPAAALELDKARSLGYSEVAVVPLLAKAVLASGGAEQVTRQFGDVTLADKKAEAQLKALLASAWGAQGQLERSERTVKQALALDPSNELARLLEARLQAGRGQIDDALRTVEAILRDDPKSRGALHLQGDLLWMGKRQLSEAKSAFQQALKADPQFLAAHVSLLNLLLSQRDQAGFRAQLIELKNAFPKHLQTRYYETQGWLLSGDAAKAREGAQQLLRAAPEEPRFLLLAGIAEMNAGALLVAETHLEKAVRLDADLSSARQRLAEVQLRSGQAAKALSTLQPLITAEAVDARPLAAAAEAYLLLGDAARASELYQRASKLNPADARLRTAAVVARLRQGDQHAFAQLEQLAAMDSSAYADLALVSARLQAGNAPAALKAIDRLEDKLAGKPLPPFLRARAQLLAGDAAAARQSLEKALKLDAAYYPATAALAALEVQQGQPAEAVKRLEAEVAREPRNVRAVAELSELHRSTGVDPLQTSGLLEGAIQRNPNDPSLRGLLVAHQLRNLESKGALASAQAAVAALPDDGSLLELLARAQIAAGENEQAASTLRKAATAQAKSVQAQLRIAEAFGQLKDREAARQALQRALAMAPDHVPVRARLAMLDVSDGHADKALRTAQELQRTRGQELAGYLLETDIQMAQNNKPAAIAAMKAAFERARSTELAVRLHALHSIGGRSVDADRFADNWLREHPKDLAFVRHLGAMALDRQDYPAAELRYRQLLQALPNDVAALNNLAWLLVQQNKPDGLDFARRAARLAPRNAAVLDTLSIAQVHAGDLKGALESQRKVVALAPQAPSYRLRLAQVLLDNNLQSEARIELDRLAALGPKFAGQAEVKALQSRL